MDRKKYVFEASDDVKKVIALGVTHGGAIWTDTMDVENFEELNSDYINEHFGDLQDDAYNKGYAQCQDDYSDALKHAKDTAYKKGLHDGESKCRYCNEYQRGLDDAWEAARKIIHMPEGDLLNIFTECYSAVCTALQVLLKYDAAEAIEKLKAYKEKQKADDEIKAGDEVIYIEHKFVVFATETEEHYASLFDVNGRHASASQSKCKKTGRHFDIPKILAEMRT